MHNIFCGCKSLIFPGKSKWKIKYGKNIENMFSGCPILNNESENNLDNKIYEINKSLNLKNNNIPNLFIHYLLCIIFILIIIFILFIRHQ